MTVYQPGRSSFRLFSIHAAGLFMAAFSILAKPIGYLEGVQQRKI